MAAKGTESKNAIWDKFMEVFPDAFWEETGKILRIPMNENGSRVEIKVSLTAAKSNLREADSAFGSIDSSSSNAFNQTAFNAEPAPAKNLEVTEEEKENVAKLLASLGL